MRYISPKSSLVLRAESGKTKYQFKDGVLVVGTETGTGGGNEIDPALANTNADIRMMVVNPAGATDLEKVGLGTQFFQAPPIIAAGTLASGSYYELIDGTANLTAGAYVGNYDLVLPDQMIQADLADLPLKTVIRATSNITVPAGTAKWALAGPVHLINDETHDLKSEAFITNNLTSFKDESSFDRRTYGSRTKDPKYVR